MFHCPCSTLAVTGDYDRNPNAWNTVEPWMLLLFMVVQLSVVLFLVRHGRVEKLYRQPFYVLFITLTIVDCFLVVTRPFYNAWRTSFGWEFDHYGAAYYFEFVLVPIFIHAQPLLQSAIALNRFTACCFPHHQDFLWTSRRLVVVVLAILAISSVLGAGSSAYYGIRNAVNCPSKQYPYCVFYWQDSSVEFAYGLVALGSLIWSVISFALNVCSVATLVAYHGLGKLNVQHHRGPALRLFFHSLFMFLLQCMTAWHNFMLFNDLYGSITMSLGVSQDDVFGSDYHYGAVGWRPVQGWLAAKLVCDPECDVLRGILRGDLIVAWTLPVRTLMPHVFALSGAPLLLIISGQARNAYVEFYVGRFFRTKTTRVIDLTSGAEMPH